MIWTFCMGAYDALTYWCGIILQVLIIATLLGRWMKRISRRYGKAHSDQLELSQIDQPPVHIFGPN